MLDICAARQAYKALEINDIGLVRSSYNTADRVTKLKIQAKLYKLLVTAYHKPKAE